MSFIKRNLVALALIFVSVLFITIGALRGEVDTVFRKAITICMECIGLG